MSIDWFRSWHGAPTDPKWLLIARKANVAPGMVSAVAWALFDYASQHADRGSIAGFDAETYAVYSGWSETDIENVLQALRAKGLITPDDRLANWEKRQPKREDDHSTERVQRHRERKRVDETQRNAAERDETQRNAAERQIKNREDEDTDLSLQTEINTNAAQNGASAGANAPVLDPFATCLRYLDDSHANKPAALARLYSLRFGDTYPPNHARLGKMAKELSGDYKALARIIWSASVPEGDPHDYLGAILSKSKARRAAAEIPAEVY